MRSLWFTWVWVAHGAGLLSHVERYEVVRPQRLRVRGRRSLEQLYPDTVRYQVTIEGRSHTLHLEKNRDLVGDGFTETHYSEDGTRVTTSPREELCYYHGHVSGDADSSVSVGICSGIRGFVRARRQVYLIEPLGQSEDGDHAVYRHEDMKVGGSSASNTTMMYDRDRDQGPRVAGLFRSRPWKTEPVPQRFVELFVVVDNTEYKRYGSETKSRILGIINHVDKLYRPLNVRVLLVGLEIWTYADYIDVEENSETTLDRFLLWRQSDLLQRTKHDNAQFVTGKDFDTDTVGLANKFAMCTQNSGGVNQDHHDNPIGLASTIAHEMGHNFGLSHDAPGCSCGHYGGEVCVMADKLRTGSQSFPESFSSCSVKQLADFMERARPGCLDRPRPLRTVGAGPRCGDALLDPGEECDCGTVEECKTPCCDAATCRLTEGSQCAEGTCCDGCQLKAAGSVCRKSAGACDLPEYCSGAAGDCPEDTFEMNGKPCVDRTPGYCHDGQCPTHEQHCWRLFGAGAGVGPESCFNLNRRGVEGSNCGTTRAGYAPCAAENLKCGSIFCRGGGESITGKGAMITVNGVGCKVVMDDHIRTIDMVPAGTRCGPNKVCLNNRCVDVSVYGKKEDCSKKCNNNGVCNHKKQCQCSPGWAPPHCDVQYADLPQGQTELIAAVCAALSVLLLIAMVIVGLMCCKKDKRDNCTSKRKVHSAPGRLNPMFQEADVKGRPQISEPTLVASTAPLIRAATPCRAAPQPPKTVSPVSPVSPVSFTSQTEPTKPQPPAKPLPPLNKPQSQAAQPNPPPVPPVKPGPPAAARAQPCTPPPPPPAKPLVHRPRPRTTDPGPQTSA